MSDQLQPNSRAFESAAFLCEQNYMTSPALNLHVHNVNGKSRRHQPPEKNVVEFAYVPAHLYHVLFEVFKNALRATIEHHGEDARELPPVEVREAT